MIPARCENCVYKHALRIEQDGVELYACKYYLGYKADCEHYEQRFATSSKTRPGGFTRRGRVVK